MQAAAAHLHTHRVAAGQQAGPVLAALCSPASKPWIGGAALSTAGAAQAAVHPAQQPRGRCPTPARSWDGGNNPEQTDFVSVRNLVAACPKSLKRFTLTTSAGVERSGQFPFFILNAFGEHAPGQGGAGCRPAAAAGTHAGGPAVRQHAAATSSGLPAMPARVSHPSFLALIGCTR